MMAEFETMETNRSAVVVRYSKKRNASPESDDNMDQLQETLLTFDKETADDSYIKKRTSSTWP